MSELLVLKSFPEEDAWAPEFRYLLSWCLLQAEEAFGKSEVRVIRGDLPAGVLSEAHRVLILGSANVLFTACTLRAMAVSLGRGEVGHVRPHRLADTGLGAERPVYTLRGYEEAEKLFFATPPQGLTHPTSHLPVSLWCRSALADALRERPLADLLDASRPSPELPSAAAGLYHEFIDYYGEERADVIPFVPETAGEVLEIGCGWGATGRLLKKSRGCRVTGVELNPVAARRASHHLDRVVHGDIESLDIERELGMSYDAILALELFEHLTNGEDFLRRIAGLVRPGGRIILSVPNVGHYAVVEDLLAGRWDYLPIGLLCYTHYRFFTRRTLEDWLRRCGFRRFRLVAQPTEEWPLLSSLPTSLPLDRESLRTKGYYVLIDV